MHFWIDKRSQCAYSGRHRVPSSLSAGVGRSRGRVCVGAGGGRKGMAAPVHRFAAVDCPPRRPHRSHRHYGAPPMPPVHSSGARRAEALYVEVPPEPQPQPTIASLAAARSVTPDTLLRTAALGLHHTPMMAPHLKFGMLVSFALATVFLAGAKYYFDKQVVRDNSSGGEAGVVCAAVACVCGVGCALSLCRATRDAPPLPPDRVSSTAQRDLGPPSSSPSDEISLALVPPRPAAPPPPTAEAPPPYNIAVLMPTRQSPPPPAYSALS
ncbi:uncharacterized protein LOC128674816 [Plodia interpunctella]|uniref:uncharacterized protein LOC128674816 n=1 Tax=Plodia interpunctella TaxID=58824 RepID=UPI0023682ABC|nr:uncharacterized protein LOC128674816 [Plodia interpunctella]